MVETLRIFDIEQVFHASTNSKNNVFSPEKDKKFVVIVTPKLKLAYVEVVMGNL